MAILNRSRIEYLQWGINWVNGCTSDCAYCYARQIARRFARGEDRGWVGCEQRFEDPAAALEAQLRGMRMTATLQGVLWPVEVQREVHERNGDKWRKAVELYGRLMLIVFSEQACEKQVRLLQAELGRWEWPTGTIRVGSLEALERGDGSWTVLKR